MLVKLKDVKVKGLDKYSYYYDKVEIGNKIYDAKHTDKFYSDDEEIFEPFNPLDTIFEAYEITEKEITDNYEQGTIADECFYGEYRGQEVVYYEYHIHFREDVLAWVGQIVVKTPDNYYYSFDKELFEALFEIVEG